MNEFVGPIQPMTGGLPQENFGQMVDHVLSWNDNIPVHLVKRRINLHLRELQNQRMWAGLMVRGEFRCPAAYRTGTIAATPDADIVQGTNTSWPYNDAVNTTLFADITVPNELQEIIPASMTGIGAGDWLLFNEGGVTEEWILVHATKSNSFQSKPRYAHSASETITKSSFSSLQLKVSFKKNYYTVIGITSDQRLKLDHPWSHPAETSATYQLIRAYVTFPAGLKIVWSIVNITQGWAIKNFLPQDVVQKYDAWRAAQSWPSLLLNFTPDHIGRMRYELYPAPLVEQGLPYLAARIIPDLADEEDTVPPCIPSHVIVNHTLADALLHDRKSVYYDPVASREFRLQAQAALIPAMQQDDNIFMQDLEWLISKYNIVSPGADYWQSHDEGMFIR